MLNDEQTGYLRSRIRERIETVNQRIRHLRRESLDVTQKTVLGDLSAYDNHPGDWGTETYERERDFGMFLEARAELRALQEALVRMERGEYGRCSYCGEDIPFERLKVMPQAQVCVSCARGAPPTGTGTAGQPGSRR